MRTPLVLVADDNPANVDLLRVRLAVHGYDVVTAADGEQALAAARERRPDLILLDVDIPKLDGLEVCRRLKGDPALPFMPVIMVTARTDPKDVVTGLESGADEYLATPVDGAALIARVNSMLRIKRLQEQVQAQAAELSEWNRTLERRVDEQVAQLDQRGRLKRFFSPALAELIVSGGADDPLRTHRREIAMVMTDLVGFGVFSETAEPEEVIGVLRQYHAALGRVVLAHEGTLERFVGDALVVVFNDPVEVPDAPARAVRLAVALRDEAKTLNTGWAKRGWNMPLRGGVAAGYATIGAVGFEGRLDYGVVGRVIGLTSYLCNAAKADEILVSQKVAAAVEKRIELEEIPVLTPRGLARPVRAFRVIALKG